MGGFIARKSNSGSKKKMLKNGKAMYYKNVVLHCPIVFFFNELYFRLD